MINLETIMSSYREDNGNFEQFFNQSILLKTFFEKKNHKIRWLIQTFAIVFWKSNIPEKFPDNKRFWINCLINGMKKAILIQIPTWLSIFG